MIKVTLLSFPQIEIDGKEARFPYKKAEALFYYLAIEKSVSRDKAVLLLWENDNEMTAKKNLRHAIYIIKKVFNADIVISPQKYLISLNPDIQICIDAEEAFSENRAVPEYDEFLKGFSMKNADNFEQWISNMRESYCGKYLDCICRRLMSIDDSVSEAENIFEKYTEKDPFDERVYVSLMQIYGNNGLFYKGIKVYQRLQKLLGDELGISPAKSTTDLYKAILNQWLESVSGGEADDDELLPYITDSKIHADVYARLQDEYEKFMTSRASNILITGENGAGKSYVVNSFLSHIDKSKVLVLSASCFQAEKNFALQSWNDIIFQLDDYIQQNNMELQDSFINSVAQFFPTFGGVTADDIQLTGDISRNFRYRSCKNSIIRIIMKIAASKKIIFFIDNINAMDVMGQDLVSSVMRVKSENIMFICTALDAADYDTVTFFSTMSKEKLFEQISLGRLTLAETAAFIRSSITDIPVSYEMIEKIHKETEGNFFFLTEAVQNIKAGKNISSLSLTAGSILDDRLNGISKSSRLLLDTISVFHDYVTLNTLSLIHEKDPLEILNDLEELKEHSLIVERKGERSPHITFIHNKMREYVCGKLSPSKCRILHGKAAEALEKQISFSEASSLKAILFHYKMAENHEKYLHYEIMNLEKYSGLNYELFPVLESVGGETSAPGEDVLGCFSQIENDLLEYHHNNPSFAQFDELFSKLMHAKSRYCILTGNYETGICSLEAGMHNPYTKSNGNFMLIFMRQMAYYAIQVYDMDILDKYTKDGLMMSLSLKNNVEHAFYHRLRGKYFIDIGDYRQAFASLIKSIDYFSKAELHNLPYIINIAASYNYLGEMNRLNGKYPEAIQHYKKALSLCNENKCAVNPVFYSNLAAAYFADGKREEALDCFLAADSAYNNTVALVGKAVTKIYTAYFKCLESAPDYLDYVSQAEQAAKTLGSPIEKGVVLYVKSKIAEIRPNDFSESPSDYLRMSNNLLSDIPGKHVKF